MGTELRALGQDAADLGLRLAAAAARVLDASRRDARALERMTAERDSLAQDPRAETVRSGALEARLAGVMANAPPRVASAYDAGIAAASCSLEQARAEADSMRALYEAKCEEADALQSRINLLGGAGFKDQEALEAQRAQLDRANGVLASAEVARDLALAAEKEALTDLAKLRSCFEAQRKALCDRLGLDSNATWADITQRVR
jgi:hypothetical protein